MTDYIQHPNLTFSEEQHEYRWNDRPVPSVTQIFDKIGYRKNDKAHWNPIGCPDFCKSKHDSDFGSAFHILPEARIKGFELELPEEMKPWNEKVLRFFDKYQPVSLFDVKGNYICEYPMYSEVNQFCGTPDYMFMNIKENVIWLVDWKTATQYQKCFTWQTAGYEKLVREVHGGNIFGKRDKIVRATVLFTADKKEPEVIKRENCPEDHIAFSSILNTFKLVA